jgi:hypothetical protein
MCEFITGPKGTATIEEEYGCYVVAIDCAKTGDRSVSWFRTLDEARTFGREKVNHPGRRVARG